MDSPAYHNLSRRTFVKRSLLTGGSLIAKLCGPSFINGTTPQERDSFAGGARLGTVDFVNEGTTPLDVPHGAELDGRLYTDLSHIQSEIQVIPVEKFYIRSRTSTLLPDADKWQVKVGGLVERPASLGIETLRKNSGPMGVHVMECAGNVRLARFGLLSAGRWSGIPISQILDNVKAKTAATRVLVSGFDRYASESKSSLPGASWIFTPKQLKTPEAFLATELDDQPLTKDHGAPVRLVVPGWYGCCCIKWVDEIKLVGEDAQATSQMQEYAGRTLQRGVPALAKDYQPAVMEQAAMPIRVEKWNVAGKLKYRIVGIAWGGTQLLKSLKIRFNPEEDYVPVDNFYQEKNDPWTIWTHAWSPKEVGTYMIRLAAADPGVQARKLDSGYYVRAVEINEV